MGCRRWRCHTTARSHLRRGARWQTVRVGIPAEQTPNRPADQRSPRTVHRRTEGQCMLYPDVKLGQSAGGATQIRMPIPAGLVGAHPDHVTATEPAISGNLQNRHGRPLSGPVGEAGCGLSGPPWRGRAGTLRWYYEPFEPLDTLGADPAESAPRGQPSGKLLPDNGRTLLWRVASTKSSWSATSVTTRT